MEPAFASAGGHDTDWRAKALIQNSGTGAIAVHIHGRCSHVHRLGVAAVGQGDFTRGQKPADDNGVLVYIEPI
jgi:hypothetical protein